MTEGRAQGGDRWTGGATSLLILCLPQQLRNYGRCANLGRADTHRRGAGGNVSVFAPSVLLSGPPAFHGPFPRSERRICDTLRSTIRRRSTAAASPTNVVCSVFSSGHAFHCRCCASRLAALTRHAGRRKSAVADGVSHAKYASDEPLINRRIRSALQDGHKPIHYLQELCNAVVSCE